MKSILIFCLLTVLIKFSLQQCSSYKFIFLKTISRFSNYDEFFCY